ncbi:MAG: aspartate aminotransferase family protein [Bacteroidota bacterium]
MGKKEKAISDFKNHVSSQKVNFYKKYKMDFVMGKRENISSADIDDNKELINLHCNGGVFNLGHRNPQIIETLTEALSKFDIGNHHFISTERAKTAKLMSELMPSDLDYTIFGVSGGEATDTALKIARSYTKKQKIISVKGGYHGHTGLALATGDEKYRKPFGEELPGFEQCTFGDIDALEKLIDSNTAAIILETIPATLGMPIPTDEYMSSIRKSCDENNILLILDEVQSGLGRTGKMWGFEHYDIVPDIVILGKGLSGGIYPISATVIRKSLESVFHDDPFIHISTYGGSELGSIVMRKVLEMSSDPDFLSHVNEMAYVFKTKIDSLIEKHSGFLVKLRQKGLMMGLELKDEISGPALTKAAYDNGLLIIYANNDTKVCQFLPPLIIEETQIDEIIEKLDKSLTDAKKLIPLIKAKNVFDKFINPIKQLFS